MWVAWRASIPSTFPMYRPMTVSITRQIVVLHDNRLTGREARWQRALSDGVRSCRAGHPFAWLRDA